MLCWTTASRAGGTRGRARAFAATVPVAKRSAEEAAGTVRWLRPEFQRRGAAGQGAMEIAAPEAETEATGGDN